MSKSIGRCANLRHFYQNGTGFILSIYLFYSARIHLWDLGAGDIYPAHTVQFGDQVNTFSLSCENGDPGMRQMLAIGLEDGRF